MYLEAREQVHLGGGEQVDDLRGRARGQPCRFIRTYVVAFVLIRWDVTLGFTCGGVGVG